MGGFQRVQEEGAGDGLEVGSEGEGGVKDMSWVSSLYHVQGGDARATGGY